MTTTFRLIAALLLAVSALGQASFGPSFGPTVPMTATAFAQTNVMGATNAAQLARMNALPRYVATLADLANENPDTGPTKVEVTGRGVFTAFAGGTLSTNAAYVITNDASGKIWVSDKWYADRIVNVRDFGATGDGTTDDTAAFWASTNASGNIFIPRGTYRITDTWEIPRSRSILCDQNASINFDGAQDRVAVRIGNTGGSSQGIKLLNLTVTTANIDRADTNYVGVQLVQLQYSVIENLRVSGGFGIGVECVAQTAGFIHTLFLGGHQYDNGIGMQVTCLDIKSNGGYFNGNRFIGGRYASSTSIGTYTSRYGLSFQGVAGSEANEVTWYAPTFELSDGNAGHVRIPVKVDMDVQSVKFDMARFESGRGPFLTNTFATSSGVCDIAFTAGSSIIESVHSVNSGWRYIGPNKDNAAPSSVTLNVADYIGPFGTNLIAAWGPFHFRRSSTVDQIPRRWTYSTGTTNYHRGYSAASNEDALCFFIDTRSAKRFGISVRTRRRLKYVAYDASGNELRAADTGYPHIMIESGVSTTNNAWGAFGYTTSSDSSSDQTILARSEAAFVEVLIGGGTSAVRADSVTVKVIGNGTVGAPRLMSPFNPLGSLNTPIAAQRPDLLKIGGWYEVGYTIGNYNVPGMTWVCTTAGGCYPNWQAGVAYTTGDAVNNDSGKQYVCTTAGTSAGSGGPTGTGTAITDNTTVWRYIGPSAVFTEFVTPTTSTPSQQAVTSANGTLTVANSTRTIEIVPSASWELTSTAQIADGFEGQELTLYVDDANAFAVAFTDEATHANSNIKCGTGFTNVVLRAFNPARVLFTGSSWNVIAGERNVDITP